MSAASRIFKWALVVLPLAAVAGYYGYSYLRPEPPSYMTIHTSTRDIVKRVYATGTLTGSKTVDVGSQVSGQILKLHAKLGDEVKEGQLLCEIDPKTAENKLKTAKAEINIVTAKITAKEAEIKKLKLDYDRQQNLRRMDATSRQSAESAESDYLVALAALEELKAQYNQDKISVEDAETNLGYTKITAPMDGTVYAVVVDPGQTVNANQTTPTILRLANMKQMLVETEISEADVVNVREGMECEFTVLGLPHRTFKAKLGRVAPAPSSEETTSSSSSSSSSSSTSSQAIYYNADLLVDNEDGLLRIDMTADVTITVASARGARALPLAALRSEHGETASVYVLEAGQVSERQIKVGLRDDQFVEVTEGLGEGDEIVIGADVRTAEQQAQSNQRRGPRGPF